MSGRPPRGTIVALLLALCGVLSTTACDDRTGVGEGTGTVAAQLTGSGLRDETESLRVLAFDLTAQRCTGPAVADPALPPLAVRFVSADVLQVNLSIPAGPRTIYVEVYRDVNGTDRFGTGCTEVVLAAGERRTLRIEVVTEGSDADGDADADDGGGEVDGEVPADDGGPDVDTFDDAPLEADDTPADGDAAEGDESDAAALLPILISEVDYQQDLTDSMEFVELYNWGTDAIACADLELHLVSQGGTAATTYLTEPLRCTTIAPGTFYVVGSTALNATISSFCPGFEVLGDGTTDLIQNGTSTSAGDGVALIRRVASLAVVQDQLVYWGPVTGWGEGSPATTDRDSAESLQRRPAAADTNDNLADFFRLAPTPCAPPP
jgi:hypothetical protein